MGYEVLVMLSVGYVSFVFVIQEALCCLISRLCWLFQVFDKTVRSANGRQRSV
jgi:hypothetical protein